MNTPHKQPLSKPTGSGPFRWLARAAAVLISAVSGCGEGPPEFQQVEVGGRTFQMELALTTKKRVRGLSDRDSLAADAGMLFVMPKAEVVSFRMKKCRFPIDIIFLGPEGKVTAMHEMAMEPADRPDRELKSYSSKEPAQFAMEFNAGTLKGLNVEVGQTIALPVEELKKKAK